jgi:peptidyl-dipeptidase A
MNYRFLIATLMAFIWLSACQQASDTGGESKTSHLNGSVATTASSPADAVDFVNRAEKRLEELSQAYGRTSWVQNNFITDDTEKLAAKAKEALTAAEVEIAAEAAKYARIPGLDDITARKLVKFRTSIVIPAPLDAAKTGEQADIGAKLRSLYGKGKFCRSEDDCLSLGELENIMAQSRNPDELMEAWLGWRQISIPMKYLYARQVELANEGAVALGFDDVGALWRSNYDMNPADFSVELDRIWSELRPLYDALHCHVRARLGEFYGTDVVPQNSPIPAHLLGNMWAQKWENIYDIVGPESQTSGYDLGAVLQDEGFDPISMVKTGEAFFSSLGFEELPETFWQRSLFVKPTDRDVVCHPSAWDVDEKDDVRIKMCIEVNEEDFKTIHHELGHNYYQRAYNTKSYLHRTSANDGFHEAVGDTLSLSITPKYLTQIGLLESEPDASGDIGLLMQRALAKVAMIPFSLMVDQWRWKVFAGEVGPDGYNDLWWELREKYQGVAAPNERPSDAFDPGAKYHVPGNTPYTRYYLSTVLQFQFFRTLCDLAGNEAPIHRCSIFGSKQAGAQLKEMLEMGRSKPWPVALESLTGTSQIDATAMLDYFAPLQEWLNQQNTGRQCGW